SGDQTDLIDTPGNLYCKAAQDDPSVVRGARNLPCMEFPGRRAPTVEQCRTGYQPLGNNPPNGPIMPPDVPSYTAVPVIPSSYDGSSGAPAEAVPYDPGTGRFIGSDGRTYTQPDLASGSPGKDSTWQTMMTGQQI
ncbi:MAG: virulence factor Mce, partial [Rhodococcus sp. (in: high G+C Gram-positive bacteria)]